jgi:NAD+ synthase
MLKDVEGAVKKIVKELQDFTDCATLGMSGGADSTLVACLCVRALGEENIYAIGLPYSDLDKNSFNSRSRRTAERLGVHYTEIPIKKQVDSVVESLGINDFVKGSGPEAMDPVQLGNIKARIRMTTLYAMNAWLTSNGQRYRVMGTGNLSEDFIGYDTKGGDALADIFPIGTLFKSEVYQMLDHFVKEGMIVDSDIDRVPSAGLWNGQTDEGELGHTYAEMEGAIQCLIDDYDSINKPSINPLLEFVRQRHLINKHKHIGPPVINVRDQCHWNDHNHKYWQQ